MQCCQPAAVRVCRVNNKSREAGSVPTGCCLPQYTLCPTSRTPPLHRIRSLHTHPRGTTQAAAKHLHRQLAPVHTQSAAPRGGTNPAAALNSEPMWLMLLYCSPVFLIRFVGDQNHLQPSCQISVAVFFMCAYHQPEHPGGRDPWTLHRSKVPPHLSWHEWFKPGTSTAAVTMTYMWVTSVPQ
jgi:hypothetical protein